MGDDIETSGTPQSDVSREGEGPSRAQVGDGDGAAMSDPIATLPTSDEGPDEGQSNGEASEPEEEEEENRSSGGSVVNFDTTSEQEPDEPDLHTMKGIKSDVAMEAPPTVASMSRDTTRSRGSADRMALHRDSGSLTRTGRESNRQKMPSDGPDHHRHRHGHGRHEAAATSVRHGRRQGRWDDTPELPEDRRYYEVETSRSRPRPSEPPVEDMLSDEGTMSWDDRTSRPSRRGPRTRAKKSAKAQAMTSDSGWSDTESNRSDLDDERPNNKRRPRFSELSRDELIEMLERAERRGQSMPRVDYMEMFSKYTRDSKIRYHGPQPEKFAYGKETFQEFHDRYQAHAMSSGWDSGRQVAAMLRFLDGRPRVVFTDWIKKGLLKDMDAKVMWALMKEKFCDPGGERLNARAELTRRVQAKGESTLAYEQVFSELATRAKLSEEEKVEKWLDNINQATANVVRTHAARDDITFDEAAKIARRADRQVLQPEKPTQAAGLLGQKPSRNVRHGLGPPVLPIGICHKCGVQGHMANECTWTGKCSYCGRENHQAPVCYERIRAEARTAEAQTADK